MATILIVDDRSANREHLVTLLGYCDHRLLQADDGAEALAIAWSEHPDLIIADILMPTMDGYELVRQLRADPVTAATPVIFYTARYHERAARALANACGVFHILIKPAEPGTVQRAVGAALGARPAPGPQAPAEEFDRGHLQVMTNKPSQMADEVRMAHERLTALLDHSLDLGAIRDHQQLLQAFGDATRKIIGAKYAIVGVPNDDGSGLRYFYTSGMDAETAARLGPPDHQRGGIGLILSESRCVRVHNPGGAPGAIDFPASYPPLRSWLGAPILAPGRVYGWVGLLNKLGAEEFSDEDERLACALAAQVGRIYENGSRYNDMRRHAMELELEVAERKRVEQALQESEAQTRLLLDSTAEAIYGIDTHGHCTFCNAACLRLLGYAEPHQLLGKNMHALIHHTRPDGTPYPLDECRIYRAFRQNEGSHVEDEVFWRDDGSGFPVEYWSYPIRRGTQISGAVITFRDISDRKRAAEELQGAQLRLQHVLSSSPAVLFTLPVRDGDQVPGIDWISDNLQDIFGHPPGAALRAGWFPENIHPEDRDHVIGQFWADLRGQERSTYEFRFRHGDSNYRWVRSELRLIRDAAGQAIEVIGSWSDVTERKVLEDQFRQSQKMEAVGRLAGGVAHDFNNLLTIITGYGELVLAALPAADPVRELIREIVAAGDRAAGLTRQLLTFSRKAIIEPKILDLKEVVIGVNKMLRPILGEDIQLTVLSDPELGAVKADPSQMEQVLLNLVVNARDAMPQGGRLTVEARNADLDETYAREHSDARAGRHVLLAVSDTGCGMDRATMARIFEPFFSTKGELGTGIGLATVHGIVKQSGGHVAVYSEVGRGTAFKVYLPRVEQRAPLGRSRLEPEDLPRGSETVLLAEDEDSVRALLRHALQGCGYTVLEARDGSEALRVAEQHRGRIDLLVTDVVMPQMGGHEVSERVAVLHPGVKVLFLSGYTDDAVVRHGILEAEVAFLQKPFTPSSLALKVRHVLDTPAARGVGLTVARQSTILVIDDEEKIQDFLRTVLEHEGYVVRSADNGVQAVREYRQQATDLVLCDIYMDRQDGLETILQLRNEFPRVRIIAMSGGGKVVPLPLLDCAEKFGVLATLHKPLAAHAVLQIVRHVLQS